MGVEACEAGLMSGRKEGNNDGPQGLEGGIGRQDGGLPRGGTIKTLT